VEDYFEGVYKWGDFWGGMSGGVRVVWWNGKRGNNGIFFGTKIQ